MMKTIVSNITPFDFGTSMKSFMIHIIECNDMDTASFFEKIQRADPENLDAHAVDVAGLGSSSGPAEETVFLLVPA